MKLLKIYLTTLFLLTFFNGFTQKTLKKFYYTFGKAKETKVYKFVDQNDSLNVFYWVITSDPEEKSIRTDSYDENFVKGDSFYEVFGRRGAELKSYSVFVKNFFGFLTERKAKVIRNKVYGWNVKSKEPYTYEVEYTDEYGKTKMIKSRSFQGIEVISLGETTYPVAKFEDSYQIELLDKKDSFGFTQFTYYAEGMGLIKYRRYASDFVMDIELDKILTKKEFESLKNQKK